MVEFGSSPDLLLENLARGRLHIRGTLVSAQLWTDQDGPSGLRETENRLQPFALESNQEAVVESTFDCSHLRVSVQ